MKNKLIEIYEFDELPKEVQKEVLDKERENLQNEDFIYDDIEENLKYYGEELFKKKNIIWEKTGVDKDKMPFVNFSLDYSHYPYAIPTGVFKTKNLTIIIKEDRTGDTKINVYDRNGYTISEISDEAKTEETEYKKSYKKEYEKFKKTYDEVSTKLLANAESQERAYYSDENIKERLEANEVEFLANGRRVPGELIKV